VAAAPRCGTNFPASQAALDASYRRHRAIPGGTAKDDGITLGEAVANAIVQLRTRRIGPAKTKVPGPAVPGEYQATPSCLIGERRREAFFHGRMSLPS
jgi:hypothetical protein